ncbi:EAL domain-containing protein [Devosia sp. 919]|uniref:bifunctional diguanylate cyclase/phosphodiesterase n=1 Tax=Devosia sp. 919 TaxID=2726065 RepID=UPI001554B882|nr:EAL domain-containing protein [Devosia sp. 919]
MLRVYSGIVDNHDPAYVALAAIICILSSFTAVGLAQRAIGAKGQDRVLWLLAAGVVTGAGVWTTHFTAMLGFLPQAGLHFNPREALVSVGLCLVLTMLGWIVGFANPQRARGLLAGVLIGAGLAIAHFFDMTALHGAEIVRIDYGLLAMAVIGGIAITALAGPLLQRFAQATLAWPAGAALALGVLFLHFVASAGIELAPLTGLPARPELKLAGVGGVLVGGSLLLLASALTLVFHHRRLADVTAADGKRLASALEALRGSEAHHRAYIELNSQIQWLSDANGRVLEMGPRWWECVAVSREQSITEGWLNAMHPDDREPVRALWARAVRTGDGSIADVRYRVRFRDGSYRWFRARARPLRDEAGTVLRWYGSLEDINDQVAAEMALRRSEERYRLASEATNDIIWDYDVERDRTTWTGIAGKVLGYPELAQGTTIAWWADKVHPEDRGALVGMEKPLGRDGQGQNTQEYRFRAVNGDYIWVSSRRVLVPDASGKPVRFVGSMLDITARKQAETELQWAAFHDPLTGLPNRALYAQRLDAALERARGTGEMVGLLVFDLNNFKTLNDTMGHAAGDRLLKEIASRLVAAAPEGVTVARLGGDEFAVISPGLAAEDLRMEVARQRLGPLDQPVAIDGLQIAVSYCAGGAVFPRDAQSAGELLRAADLALYAAKADLPGTIRGFQPQMLQASEARARALANARKALDTDAIVPFYQPKLCLRSGQVTGFEALLRWHDQSGLQPPASIAAAFDDAQLSVEITDRMLDRVLADCVAWREGGLEVGRVALNLSAADLRQRGLAERVLWRLDNAGLPGSVLELEVTESVLISQMGGHVSTLEKLQQAGVTIALDDFGTGYASLTHLQQFKVDVLKIDRSFVELIGSSERRDTAVINAVLEMSRSMGITTVAEGIERREQAEFLHERGCDLGQGYLFSRPIPASRVPDLLEQLEERRWEAALRADQTAG